ncbi:MAG: ABC transporter permease [Acidimicrobiia bacterium]
MRRALKVEFLKARRSTVVLATTVLIAVLVPLLCLGFVAVAKAGGAGAVALKAQAMVVGEGWEAYLGLLAQIVSIAMFIGPGVVVAWAFGREFSDRTFPSLFGLPVSKGSIATAKFIVLAWWGLVLTVLTLGAAILVGLVAHVGSLAGIDLAGWLWRLLVAGFLTSMISLTIGFVASVGRGYLPAFGALILLTMITQIAVLFGTGGWFPYAAPGLYAIAGTADVAEVSIVQLLLVPVTTLVVAWLTVRWWNRAEVV